MGCAEMRGWRCGDVEMEVDVDEDEGDDDDDDDDGFDVALTGR